MLIRPFNYAAKDSSEQPLVVAKMRSENVLVWDYAKQPKGVTLRTDSRYIEKGEANIFASLK
jgi:hypothetical protein